MRFSLNALAAWSTVYVSPSRSLTLRNQPFDGRDTRSHLECGRRIGRMYGDLWWSESMKRDRFLNPKNHVIAGTACIIAQVVIETEFVDLAGLK